MEKKTKGRRPLLGYVPQYKGGNNNNDISKHTQPVLPPVMMTVLPSIVCCDRHTPLEYTT